MKKLTTEEKRRIEEDAVHCAKTDIDPQHGCPWPYASEEGRHWIAIYLLNINEGEEECN